MPPGLSWTSAWAWFRMRLRPSRKRSLPELPQRHAQRVAELLVDTQHGGRLEAAMDHAVFAAGIVAAAQLVPIGQLHEVLMRLVMTIGDQIAGALPATNVAGGICPGGAFQIALTAQEFEIDRRRI